MARRAATVGASMQQEKDGVDVAAELIETRLLH
jgi:hypothetical protein